MLLLKKSTFISLLLLLNTSASVMGTDTHTLVDALNNDVIVVEDTDENSWNLFSGFTDNDWSDFLKDHGIHKVTKEKSNSLKEYCSNKWHELISDENYENSPDYLSTWFNSIKDSDLVQNTKEKIDDKKVAMKAKAAGKKHSNDNISSWVFNSWDVETLRNFLKKNNIYLSQDLSTTHDKDKLVKVCKENFKYLSNRSKASGYYLSNGYLDSWSDNELTTWLDKYKVKHQKKSTTDNLKKLVKENLYRVSNTLKKSKSELMNNLAVDSWSAVLLDKTKKDDDKIKSLLDNLSTPDLVKWLKAHDVEFDKNFDFNNRKSLTKHIKDNHYIDYLTNDVSDYLLEKKNQAEKHGDTILQKSSKQIASQLDNLKSKSEESYGSLKDWSLENLEALQEDLTTRYHIASKKTYKTKDEILKNIEDIKKEHEDTFYDYYDQAVDSLRKQTDQISSFFDGWSLENLKKWAGDSASTINDNKNDLIVKSKAKFDELYPSKKDAQKKTEDVKKFWYETLESWSSDDLKEYLISLKKKNIIKDDEKTFSKMNRQQLYEKCKENTLWFITAGQYTPPSRKDILVKKIEDQINFVKSKIPFFYN